MLCFTCLAPVQPLAQSVSWALALTSTRAARLCRFPEHSSPSETCRKSHGESPALAFRPAIPGKTGAKVPGNRSTARIPKRASYQRLGPDPKNIITASCFWLRPSGDPNPSIHSSPKSSSASAGASLQCACKAPMTSGPRHRVQWHHCSSQVSARIGSTAFSSRSSDAAVSPKLATSKNAASFWKLELKRFAMHMHSH